MNGGGGRIALPQSLRDSSPKGGALKSLPREGGGGEAIGGSKLSSISPCADGQQVAPSVSKADSSPKRGA